MKGNEINGTLKYDLKHDTQYAQLPPIQYSYTIYVKVQGGTIPYNIHMTTAEDMIAIYKECLLNKSKHLSYEKGILSMDMILGVVKI